MPATGPRPGSRNAITDVPGLTVGHATDEGVRSGVTVLLCGGPKGAAGWAGGVDVRGGGPGTRETEMLAAENLVGRAHAVVLTGGSVFGLAAADGVVAVLSRRGMGLTLRPGTPAVPLVPAAVLYDLANGGDKDWGLAPPYRDLGMRAVEAAGLDVPQGALGAGRGAMAGLVPGGIGTASLDLGDGLVVGALVAANPLGSVFMPDGRTYWAWPFEIDGEFGGRTPQGPMDASDPVPELSRLGVHRQPTAGANTTIAVVAASADLSTAECKRVAMMAQDGIARAARPAHTPFDGDTVFAVARGPALSMDAGSRWAQVARIGSAAADCLARAIARAVYHAGDGQGGEDGHQAT
ncbi:L-aminopeptidase/D-esterase-like protein [Nitrospirillum amazonense]|uniref:L-aminopeptidase/D-esterase-like protein n=1 Tax=Nitrospirillum amazonense TaxID=28077 RepID=A0A560FT90_9PROT|nr:P1 family peptidase [Nitrospirillum amazonense]TWB24856.1 L-aminopeptidase/D-esterase-like protein [Nitrospirillum amazonense]